MICRLSRPLHAVLLLTYAVLANIVSVSAQDTTPAASPMASQLDRIVLPGDAVFPEGIAYQPETGDVFVGSLADGTIYRADPGSSEAEAFLPAGADGRVSALGLRVDAQGRLFVAGGDTGLIFVYDTPTEALLARLTAAPDVSPEAPTLVNDVAVTPDGAAYVTDSLRPMIYRVADDSAGGFAVEEWLDLSEAGVAYGEGVNFNGIVATPDGRRLIAVQANTGKLFRIDIASAKVDEIVLAGGDVTNGDGMVLVGDTLWVVRNQDVRIAEIRLTADALSGEVIATLNDPALALPTTAAVAGGTLLVVNSQFDRQGGPVATADAAPRSFRSRSSSFRSIRVPYASPGSFPSSRKGADRRRTRGGGPDGD